jgi:hypothetical protein
MDLEIIMLNIKYNKWNWEKQIPYILCHMQNLDLKQTKNDLCVKQGTVWGVFEGVGKYDWSTSYTKVE